MKLGDVLLPPQRRLEFGFERGEKVVAVPGNFKLKFKAFASSNSKTLKRSEKCGGNLWKSMHNHLLPPPATYMTICTKLLIIPKNVAWLPEIRITGCRVLSLPPT